MCSQREELCALLFPFTSSSSAHEDELSCHRLAAGGGLGGLRATYLESRVKNFTICPYQQLKAHEDELSCHRLAAGRGFGRPARYFVHCI